MSPTVASLLCLGLWLGQKIPSAEGQLFRPSIRAVPSSVFPREAEVKFSCQGPQGSKSFQLWEDENLLLQINITREEVVFPFPVKGANAKGPYRCRYWQWSRWSEFSAPLRLLVTGFFARPSFRVRPGSLAAAGDTVTLTCQIFLARGVSKLTFFLLKAGVPDPLQFQSTEEKVANFTLPSVKAEDAGNYSCIYSEEGRRGTSDPSEVLKLEVTDEKNTHPQKKELGTALMEDLKSCPGRESDPGFWQSCPPGLQATQIHPLSPEEEPRTCSLPAPSPASAALEITPPTTLSPSAWRAWSSSSWLRCWRRPGTAIGTPEKQTCFARRWGPPSRGAEPQERPGEASL